MDSLTLNLDTVQTKRCPTCKQTKPLTEFHRDSRTESGINCRCKLCRKAHRRKTHNPARCRDYNLQKLYGITEQQYRLMLLQQGGVCAICGQPETDTNRTGKVSPLAVDHCHDTGKVRGLLCGKCNQAIGGLRDNLDLFARAMAYISQHKQT